VDEALLRAVVQVADHAPALGVARRRDPRAGVGQLRPRLRVGDGRPDQLGELGDARLGVGGQRLRAARRGDDRSPETTADAASRWSSTRAGRPVRRILPMTLSPSSVTLVPTSIAGPASLQSAMTVAVPSSS
jgi:hypothetical protein